MRERTADGESRLVLAAQNFHLEAGLCPHELQKLLAVAGLAYGARRDNLCALDAELLGERLHPGERAQRVLDRDVTDASSLRETRSQSGRCLHLVDNANDAGR